MRPSFKLALPFLASASLLSSAASADHVSDGKWTFTTTLTATAEAGTGTGDPTMSGTFTMTVNPGDKEVCYTFMIVSTDANPSLDVPVAAHIHIGDEEVAGPIVIPLETPDIGVTEDCSNAASNLLAKLIAKPDDYYVNVHTAAHPAGAIRGDFERPDHN